MVALVMNLATKSISPQFHTIFDDSFTMVPADDGKIDADTWMHIVQLTSARLQIVLDEDAECKLADEWLTANEARE